MEEERTNQNGFVVGHDHSCRDNTALTSSTQRKVDHDDSQPMSTTEFRIVRSGRAGNRPGDIRRLPSA